MPTPCTSRKAPKQRVFQEDEGLQFLKADTISSFADLSFSNSPPGFKTHQTKDFIVYYNLVFNEDTGFPSIKEAIKIDSELHVQLQLNGSPVPLPAWFIDGRNAKLSRFSMLQNFPVYLSNKADEMSNNILEELQRRQHYKPKGQPPYSAEMRRYALLLRYSSAQCYKYLLKQFPFPSFSTLNKLKQGGMDSLKALKFLRETDKISKNIVLMADEMYLQKSSQYQSGEYVGTDANGNFTKVFWY